MLGLTRSAALEYASSGIRINAVGPGPTLTPITEAVSQSYPEYFDLAIQSTAIGRIAHPTEMASAILFLASDDASYDVGHNFIVDGGFSID